MDRGPPVTPFLRFMSLMIGIDLAGFLLAGLVFPADRTGQLLIAVPTLAFSPVIAFGVVYGFDPSALTDPFGTSDVDEADAAGPNTPTADEREQSAETDIAGDTERNQQPNNNGGDDDRTDEIHSDRR